MELWMVASDTDDGTLPSLDTLAWRLRRASGPLADILLVVNTKFLDGASEMLASCTQHATSEKRQRREEGEIEAEKRERAEPPMPNVTPVPAWESKAKESWSRHLGGENDYIFADLVPVVRRHGVSDTLEAWERYCAAQAEIEGGKFASARSFAQKPGPWLKKPEPERRHKTVAELTKQALEELAVQG